MLFRSMRLGGQSATFAGSGGALIGIAATAGLASAPMALTGGVGFGAVAAYFAASFAFRAGLQSRRDATRNGLTDFLSGVADQSQLERLKNKCGLNISNPDKQELQREVVIEVLKREPELITDVLLAALRKELSPLNSHEMDQQVRRDANLKDLQTKLEAIPKGSDEYANAASDLKAVQDEIDAAAKDRLQTSPAACFVMGLGADPEHILAIADSYQTKAMDGLARELLNFTVKKVARLDAGLKDGAYSSGR